MASTFLIAGIPQYIWADTETYNILAMHNLNLESVLMYGVSNVMNAVNSCYVNEDELCKTFFKKSFRHMMLATNVLINNYIWEQIDNGQTFEAAMTAFNDSRIQFHHALNIVLCNELPQLKVDVIDLNYVPLIQPKDMTVMFELKRMFERRDQTSIKLNETFGDHNSIEHVLELIYINKTSIVNCCLERDNWSDKQFSEFYLDLIDNQILLLDVLLASIQCKAIDYLSKRHKDVFFVTKRVVDFAHQNLDNYLLKIKARRQLKGTFYPKYYTRNFPNN